VSSRLETGGNFLAHFTTLFTSSNPLIENEMLDLFSPIISEEENAFFALLLMKRKFQKLLLALEP
jgi:hypothetical protein